MKTHANLPNQYDASTAQIINELHTRTIQLEQENATLIARNQWLEAQIRLYQKRRFGASSEKTTSLQQAFQFVFNEAVFCCPAGGGAVSCCFSGNRRT